MQCRALMLDYPQHAGAFGLLNTVKVFLVYWHYMQKLSEVVCLPCLEKLNSRAQSDLSVLLK